MLDGQPKSNPFKIVGLIVGVFAILSAFIGGTMWISMNIANNTVAITNLAAGQNRNEILISKNSEILMQHDRLLVVIEQHTRQLKTLTDFMTLGNRFTAKDGEQHARRIADIETWIKDAPPMWFREMFSDFKRTVNYRLDKMENAINSLHNRKEDGH